MKNLLFTFEDLKSGNKSLKKLADAFTKAGPEVISQDVDPKVKRTAGITYREASLTFADSQKVTLAIKQTGDVYQVKVNGAVLPLKNPDDHAKAIAEVVKALDAGRVKFQAKQARVKVTLPEGTKSKVSDTAEKGKSRLQELDEQIAKATKERDGLKAELGGGAGHSIKYGDDVRNIKLNKAGVVRSVEGNTLVVRTASGDVEWQAGDVEMMPGDEFFDSVVLDGLKEDFLAFSPDHNNPKYKVAAKGSTVTVKNGDLVNIYKKTSKTAFGTHFDNQRMDFNPETGVPFPPRYDGHDTTASLDFELKHNKQLSKDAKELYSFLKGLGKESVDAFTDIDAFEEKTGKNASPLLGELKLKGFVKRGRTISSFVLDSITDPDSALPAEILCVKILDGLELAPDQLGGAVNTLMVALDTVENNEPINRAAGNVAMADLELKEAASFRKAITILTDKAAVAGDCALLDSVKYSVKVEFAEPGARPQHGPEVAAYIDWAGRKYGIGASLMPATAADRKEFGPGTFRFAKGDTQAESIVKIDPKGMKIHFIDNEHYEATDEVKWGDSAKLNKLVIYNKANFEAAYKGGAVLDSIDSELLLDAVFSPSSTNDGEIKEIFSKAKADWKAAYAAVDAYGEEKLEKEIAESFVAYGIGQYKKEKPSSIFLGSALLILLDGYDDDVLGGVSHSKLPVGQNALKGGKALMKRIIDTAWGKGSFDYLYFINSKASASKTYPEAKTPDWAKGK